MRLEKLRRMRYLVGAMAIAASAGVLVALLTVGGASGAPASTVLATFDTPGTYTWTVPTGVRTVIIDVYGAAGGNVSDGNTLIARGGLGGEAKGTFKVKPGQTYEIVVGGHGGNNQGSILGYGGFNGGGFGSSNDPDFGGAGGGGGSDVRVGGFGNPCLNDMSCGYGGRMIVGGGGGGGSGDRGGVNGGAGGGLEGSPADSGGTQEAGGDPDNATGCGGSFGDGGWGYHSYPGKGPGGGGGGWYGGACTFNGSGTGGGSGFISHFARKGSFPGGFRGGDGLVVISIP